MPWPSPGGAVLGLSAMAQSPLSILQSNFQSQSFWTWTGTASNNPTVTSYTVFPNCPTKTGLMPIDLQSFVGVPTVINNLDGSQTPLTGEQLLTYLRQAEDWVETESGILLAQAWIASPPLSQQALVTISPPLGTTSNGPGQQYGVDYDIIDAGYDFFYRRFVMEGWGIQQLRYRPLKTMVTFNFIYPLLSEFFNIPRTWLVEDWDAAILRVVPNANTQMLPLFAMQLAFMGFAQSLPGGMYMQYIAGLNQVDYSTRFSFMRTLVLATAAIYLLNTLQGSVNFGAIRQATSVDGLRYDTSFPNTGAAYGGLLQTFTNMQSQLLRTAIDMVRGVVAFVSL
jgi:hypothetical protein